VFREFVRCFEPGGAHVTCVDDPGAAALAADAEAAGVRVLRYGHEGVSGTDATLLEYRPEGSGSRVLLRHAGAEHRLRLAVPGEHMALNALGALLAGVELGAPVQGMLDGLAVFDGVRRRFEFRGRAGGVAVNDDYAHHPAKVAAQLRAARDVLGSGPAAEGRPGDGRLIVAFQPHLYSRTRAFAAEFGKALGLADEVVVLEVYGAREDPEPGVNGGLVADAVPLPGERVHYEPRWADVPAVVAGLARAGDLVITMGAGDVTVLGPEILLELEQAD
jgi:UDP-N-acetylmuramate--alanine ligase